MSPCIATPAVQELLLKLLVGGAEAKVVPTPPPVKEAENPFFRDDNGRLRCKFDEIRIEAAGGSWFGKRGGLRLQYRYRGVSLYESDAAMIDFSCGDSLNISGILGSMGIDIS